MKAQHALFRPLIALTLCAFSQHGAATEADDQPLQVMLQGNSSEQLSKLVTENGGEVSHYLPIINAVGARLTRAQLDQTLKSPLITRYVDDLSMTPELPADPEEACDIGGALELSLTPGRASWRLFNKHSDTAVLETLEISWPASLGRIETIQLGENQLPPKLFAQQTNSQLKLELADKERVKLVGNKELTLSFGNAAAITPPALQSEFSISASFSGDCSVELIPGYAENGTDTYYPTVVGADTLHRHGVTGAGVTVAVLDSGLWEAPGLAKNTRGKDRVLARYDAILNSEADSVFDESGHGTHMTSVLAHSGPVTRAGVTPGSFKGVAPDADIVAVKAFNEAGQGDMLDIVRGVQWVIENRSKHNIRVLNLSFAARPRWPYWLDPINQAVMRAWAAGIVVVAAAGNEGPESMSVGSPGNLPYIITVGAVTDSWTIDTRDDDYIPDFSSRGPTPSAHIKPDIVAPGGHMAGITRPGSTLTQDHPEYLISSGEFVMTGTSQAAALISGVAALLLQMEPELSPDDIKCKLTSSAELAINLDGGLAYTPFQQGNGYASATRAVTLGQRGCGNIGLDISADIAGTDHFQGPAIVDEEGNPSLPGLSELHDGSESDKGYSATRRWGVKEHIEREISPKQRADFNRRDAFDWETTYLEERAAMENLASPRQ